MSYKQRVNIQKEHIDEIKKNCGKCLKDILRSASEAKEISRCAEYELEAQTEQMERINKELDNIGNILLQTHSNLHSIKSLWFSIFSYFGFVDTSKEIDYIGEGDKDNREYDKRNEEEEEDSQPFCIEIDCQPKQLSDVPQDDQQNETSTVLDIASSDVDVEDFDEIYEDGLNSLNIMLDELHTRALTMGSIINKQNTMLNNVNAKMENNIDNIKNQQKLMKDIMKK